MILSATILIQLLLRQKHTTEQKVNFLELLKLAVIECLKNNSMTIVQGFPTRDAMQYLRGCEMVIHIFLLHC